MGRTAADVLVDTRMEWGVDVVFELPGEGISGSSRGRRRS
jgi:hypothetical protein